MRSRSRCLGGGGREVAIGVGVSVLTCAGGGARGAEGAYDNGQGDTEWLCWGEKVILGRMLNDDNTLPLVNY